ETHDGGINGLTRWVVRISGKRGDVEAAGVEEVPIGGIVGDRREREIVPCGAAAVGLGCRRGKEMAACGAAAVQAAGHARIEHGRARILRRSGVIQRTCGGKRTKYRIRATAGGILRSGK